MRNTKTLSLLFVTCLMLPLIFSCGKDDKGTGPETTPPPDISVASVNVTCGNTQDCIQFFARPDKDVILVKVVITNPTGDQVTFNLESSTVIADENIGLQADDFAYFRISGEWEFVFTGNLATGDKSSFEVTTNVNVSA